MTQSRSLKAVVWAAILLAGGTSPAHAAAPSSSPRDHETSDSAVSATFVPGAGAPNPPPPPAQPVARPGPVSLNFPSIAVDAFAKAVLGEVLGLPYAVDPSVHGAVTLITTHSIAKADVLPVVEDALKTSGLALELRAGVYTIVPLGDARTQAPAIGADQLGFGNETLTLRFASPTVLKQLIDPIMPGVVSGADTAGGTMVLSGTSGQRRAARDFAEQLDVDWLKGMSFALFVPKNTDARLIAPELDKLINAPGSTVAGMVRLIAMDRLDGILAIAPRADYLNDVAKWVEVLDREGQSSERRLYVYKVQNGRATDLANLLVSAFGGTPVSEKSSDQKRAATASGAAAATPVGVAAAAPDAAAGQTLPGQSPAPVAKSGGQVPADTLVVTANEANNAVVAYATPREYALIESALNKLDITPLQVVIEANISEVTLNDALKYGTQWFFQTHGNQVALTTSTTGPAPVQNLPGFVYSVVNNGGVTATLNALSTVSHVQILSAPNLMVLNNQTASLEVGSQVPITTGSAVSTLSSNAPVVNSVDYRDTGVILKVTPRVNSSGLVLLDISQEVSQVDNTSQASASNPISSPIISERKVASSIAVQDGQTIALGGLISDDVSKTRNGIPFLSAIPVLGALAGQRNDTRERTELLILLTPRVIRSANDAQAVADELKRKIRSIEPQRPRFEP